MTRREIALHLLQEAGSRGVTTAEFLRAGAGSRFGARVAELRQAGHEISCEAVRPGSYKYVLEVGTGAARDSDSARLTPRAGSGTDTSPSDSDPGSAPPAAGPGSARPLFELEPHGYADSEAA